MATTDQVSKDIEHLMDNVKRFTASLELEIKRPPYSVDQRVNMIIRRLEALRSKVKLYAKLKEKETL